MCGIKMIMASRSRVAYRWWDVVIAWIIVTVVDVLFAMKDAMASVRALLF